jgi:hypothetical protein
MTTPDLKDPVYLLPEQVVIFQLRTQHIPLNAHLNRIKPRITPTCLMCNYNQETVTHRLLECPTLSDLRQTYLPPKSNIENTLYAHTTQLKRTCSFLAMASGQKARAQEATGSVK